MWHFTFFQRFGSGRVGSPDPSSDTFGLLLGFRRFCFYGPSGTLPAVYVSAVIDVGSHPFPFRTRKLSRLSPMVLGLRARESRSLQDSRPLDGKPSRGLFLCTAVTPATVPESPSRTRARDGLPPTHEGVASDSVRARGRPTPHRVHLYTDFVRIRLTLF